MGGLSMYSLLVSFLIMGIVLLALASSFSSVATTYGVSITNNTTQFFTVANQSQNLILNWSGAQSSNLAQNDPTSNLATWITTGIATIILSPFYLMNAFVNLLGAFQNSLAFALGIGVGDVAFISNAIIAIITLTFLYTIIKGLTGKE